MSTALQTIYDELGIKLLFDTIKEFSQNINDYMPLSKMFFIIIYIFNFDFKFDEKEKINKYILYIIKF